MLGLIAQVFWALYTVFSASLIIFINLIPINVIDELIINDFFFLEEKCLLPKNHPERSCR